VAAAASSDTASDAVVVDTKVESTEPAATTDTPSTDEVGTDETTEEARIRGGGKVTPSSTGRNNRRHAPYSATTTNNAAAVASDGAKNCRVYVGNLAWDISWQDLKDHFKDAGLDVKLANVMSGPDGRSKGCGIVEFSTPEMAQKAVLTMNDTDFNGRQIFVREDREGPGSTGAGAGGAVATNNSNNNTRAFGSDEGAQSRRVYVGNLSWDVAWQDLKDHMRECGEVVHAEVITEANGRSKGCGIVEYATAEEASQAVTTLTDTELKGRMIFVREDRETSSGAFSGAASTGARGGGGRAGGGNAQGTSVYVWNLSYETSWQDLKDHMRAAGNVDNATILTGPDGRSIGCGIVVYQHPKEAARAIRELQNSELNDRPLYVREDRVQGGGGGRGGRTGGRGSGRDGGRGGRGSGRGPPRGEHPFRSSGETTASAAAGDPLDGELRTPRDEPRGGESSGTQLFISNLSYQTSWQNLKDHFRQCGEVEHVNVMEGPGGRKKGVGTVRMSSAAAAQEAVAKLNGVDLDGRNLEVRIDQRV
jgi:RNA recognition motif-containing protein